MSESSSRVFKIALAIFGALTLLSVGAIYAVATGSAEKSSTPGEVSRPAQDGGVLQPGSSASMSAAPPLSREEFEAIQARKLEMRERWANTYADRYGQYGAGKGDGSDQALADAWVPETNVVEPADTQFHGPESNFVIGRNNQNTNANNAAKGSTLAEPAAANNGSHVYAAGNFDHAEFSSNGGATWVDVPLPAAPAAAPILCCDHDVLIDDARRVTFHSFLYVNNSLSDGVVRIAVLRNAPVRDCFYDITTFGNALPDYPHIGVSQSHLYLTTNNVGTDGGFARIFRFGIQQMADCLGTPFSTFTQSFNTFGQRVWVPVEGTNNLQVMYWGQLDNTGTFRIFRWFESIGAVGQFTRLISTSTHGDPDCRGGVGNFDYIGGLNASINGFQLRGTAAPGAPTSPAGGVQQGSGALAFYWQAGPSASLIQGHVRSAIFRLHDLVLINQPHVFNSEFCVGFPHVSANKRGDIGTTLAIGGRAGGGGSAAEGVVGIDDRFTPGLGFFQNVFFTATGTHNRSDGRFGDYFTIHAHEPCEKWFTATNYARLGTTIADINSRYVEFGRNDSSRCWNAHRSQEPAR